MNMNVLPFKTENKAIEWLSENGCHTIEYASHMLLIDGYFIHRNTLLLVDPRGQVEQHRHKPRFLDWLLLMLNR